MTSLSLNRPALARTYASVLNGIFNAPRNIAHAQTLRREAEEIMSKSDAELEAEGLTRSEALFQLAQRA